ncbi:MAG TPA: O-antigen ligase family protein [Thermoanaerobaculia bacterium]|nr:O-antigen ligase family protein [Thermoanaerobaculia bacterium]
MPRPAPKRPAAPAPEDAVESRLVPAGVLLALVLPFVIFSTASSAALRESKLMVQALGSSLALLGLAASGAWGFASDASRSRAARLAPLSLAAALALALASAAANARVVDPLVLAAVLSPLALVVAGASRPGARVAARAATLVCLAGALSGLLAAAQRWLGVFRMPLDAPEARFFAAGLVGNPGDLAMALVAPAVLCFATAADALRPPRLRGLAAAGLAATLLGIAATEAVAPALAFGAGALVYVLLSPRRRLPALLALGALAGILAVSGGANRVLLKIGQLRRGDVSAATTQRDIGLLAAAEMIRAHPLLGIGPGAFSNAFVPARVAAEERTGRHLVHLSESAHFDNAHSEPVTLAAECGLPAAAAAGLGLLALLAALLAMRHGPGAESSPTTDALLATLAAGVVLSLGEFPVRLPVASGPLAFFLGLAWRRAAPGRAGHRPLGSPARGGLAAAGAALLALAVVRTVAVSSQAEGEILLREAAALPADAGPEREALLSASGEMLGRTVALRPRDATALLALGSVAWLERDLQGAHTLYARSVALEERAESDLNLGRAALSLGREAESDALFRRAVWILPRLAEALPAGVDRARIASENDAAAAALPRGGRAPGLPANL